jgi:hypothetical protein
LRNFIFYFTIVCISVGFLSPSFAQNSFEKRNRIEELFIWKISEELQLTIQEEKSFSELLRSLNQRRVSANLSLAEVTKKMAVDKASAAIHLVKYQNLLRDYSSVSQDEVTQLKKILGVARTAAYIVVKAELSEKLKSLLALPQERSLEVLEQSLSVKLPPPRLIEE